MAEDFVKETISNIRGCLVSAKGKITVRQLEHDYETLIGTRIPCQKLGHRTIESFLASFPSEFEMSRGGDGQTYVDARLLAKSAHIAELVGRQKPAKKKVRPHYKMAQRHHVGHVHPERWRPNNGRASTLKQRKPVVLPARLAAVSHNQFVNYPVPKVPSKVVVPNPHHARLQASQNYNQMVHGHNHSVQSHNQTVQAHSQMVQSNHQTVHNHNQVRSVNNQTVERREVPNRTEAVPTRRSPQSPKKEIEVRSMKTASTTTTTTATTVADLDDSSLLNNTKKRLSKIMSEINLDRDSGNSSPTLENAKVQVSDFERTDDAITDLKIFVEMYKLGTIDVKFTEKNAKQQRRSNPQAEYYCKIKIGSQYTYSSYPQECRCAIDAERYASSQALDDLISKQTRRQSLLISSNEDIIERIPPMLQKHQSAVWQNQIELDYEDRYQEKLPSDWLQVIDRTPNISIERCHGGFVLTYCDPNDILQKDKKLDLNISVTDVSVPCNTVQFSVDNRLVGCVTHIQSAGEIWCQNTSSDEFEAFIELITEMERYYEECGSTLLAPSVSYGCCYIIKHDGSWYRVRALHQQANEGKVDCFLLDYGEQMDVPINNVYLMKRKYAAIQAQAFVCRLEGLEELYDASQESPMLARLLHEHFVLEVRMDDSESSRQHLPVIMYHVKTGKSINEELITLLAKDVATPVLNKNTVTQVFVSNIEPNGDVYVQVHSSGYQKLEELMLDLHETVSKGIPEHICGPVTPENSQGKLYLVKHKITGRWVRASIIDWAPWKKLCQIYFIDYGNAEVVSAENDILLPIDELDDVVGKYPAQALKVRMLMDEIPQEFVSMAQKLMPEDQEILLKIVKCDDEDMPVAEFYKRSQEGGLFCINKSIAVEAELQSTGTGIVKGTKATLPKLLTLTQYNENSKSVPSGGSLSKPKLPAKGEYFNVNIPFAVNPYNFFVQPLDSLGELTALMQEMQEDSKHVEHSSIKIEDIVPGNIYASRHEDGLFYRTSVLKIINPGSISVFYCDFGYYTNLTVKQLLPLHEKYTTFPYQALKAKLVGIKPVHNRWSMEDCDYFEKLVTKRQYVSVLVEIVNDSVHPSDIVLNLMLIDTSSDEDVYLKDVLIRKGIAVAAE